MTRKERFEGCIIGGAIGDAFGSGYENQIEEKDDIFYLYGKPEKPEPKWQITDDTQLTLATCEAIIKNENFSPESLAHHFVKLFKQKRLTGLGASTLKALRELEVGGHWSQVGRRGEYAAGNGAAMRIAPIAFLEDTNRKSIRELCSITHHSDEAYIGALSVVVAIREILNKNWTGSENLFEIIIAQIPDTRVRDRLIEINHLKFHNLKEVGKLGSNGYVVNSIPLAIAAASLVNEIGIEKMYNDLIEIGGDTDTNCSIAGQIAGTLVGINNIPIHLQKKLSELKDFDWIKNTIEDFKNKL